MGTGIDGYLKPDNVVAHSPSKTRAIVDVGNKSLKEFSVPPSTELKIHIIIVAYLHSVACKKLSNSHRKNIVLGLEKLLELIEENEYQSDDDIPVTLFEKFTTFLKDNTDKKGYSVKDTLNKAKVPFEWAIEHPELAGLSPSEILHFKKILINTPHIHKCLSTKKPSLSVLFPNCPYTDSELISSLKLIMCWTLLEYERQRHLLLDEPEISALVEELKAKDIQLPPMDFGTWSGKKTQAALEAECRYTYGILAQKVIDIGDDLIIERLLTSIPMPFDFPLKDDEWELMTSKLVTKDGLFTTQYRYNRKPYNVSTISSLTFRDLIAPSHVEVFAAQCFFASDRLQTSNLERLTLSDISSNERGTQTRHVKNRRVRRKVTWSTKFTHPS